ncbi:MAG: low affinity iron permease family protein [Gemmataceae bacterium]
MIAYRTTPFSRIAKWTSHAAGHPITFCSAVLVIILWALLGPYFRFSDTWQLVINTATTIITFLMVFLVQNTQNRDSAAVQLKLDELIRSMKGAHNALLDLEELTEQDLDRIRCRYAALARHARQNITEGLIDTDTPEVEDK